MKAKMKGKVKGVDSGKSKSPTRMRGRRCDKSKRFDFGFEFPGCPLWVSDTKKLLGGDLVVAVSGEDGKKWQVGPLHLFLPEKGLDVRSEQTSSHQQTHSQILIPIQYRTGANARIGRNAILGLKRTVGLQ